MTDVELFPPPATAEQLDELEQLIERWLARERETNPVLVAVDRDPQERRWFVRLRGEEKDFTTVWLTLGQRTLQYETYVMPAPEENHAQFYEHLLRRNHSLYGAAFSIGDEDAVFLRGQLSLACVDEHELDRILGSLYVYVEQFFRPAMRIGFATRFRR
ncbi:MAG TPA: YbjN domain-containing protein [Acidimicrobiales bacterium]